MKLLLTFFTLLAFISACFAETEEDCKENHFFSVHKNRCFGMKFLFNFTIKVKLLINLDYMWLNIFLIVFK